MQHAEKSERARIVLAQALPKMDGEHLKATLVEVNYGPGESSAPHSHPCPVIGYVVAGTLRTQVRGETEAVYKAGESFYEPANGVHAVSANASADGAGESCLRFLFAIMMRVECCGAGREVIMHERSFEAETLARGAAVTERTVNWERWGILYARFALGAAFLSGIADRFGWYTGRNVGYGNFAGFVDYTAKVNSFMPAFTIPFLAWAATAAELSLGHRV